MFQHILCKTQPKQVARQSNGATQLHCPMHYAPQREDQPAPWTTEYLPLDLPTLTQHYCLSGGMVAFSYLARGLVTSLLQPGDSLRKCWLESTQDEQGFGPASWS